MPGVLLVLRHIWGDFSCSNSVPCEPTENNGSLTERVCALFLLAALLQSGKAQECKLLLVSLRIFAVFYSEKKTKMTLSSKSK